MIKTFGMLSRYASSSTGTLQFGERFWKNPEISVAPYELLRFSIYMGFFTFAGYLFSYAITGKIWNWFPWSQSTLPTFRAIMCAGLQWVFFSTFPVLSSFMLEAVFPAWRSPSQFHSSVVVATYSMTPLFFASLFVGVPFLGRMLSVLGGFTFIYLLYYGYRMYGKQRVWRSAITTLLLLFLFALIRQMFVFVIGF